ncbi:MAG: oxidoreductase, partial [Enterobacteriaceae bacterium]
ADQRVNNPSVAKRFTLTPEAILPKLRHALESPRPKIRYRITLVSHTLALLKRLLPDRCLDRVLRIN